MNEPPREITTTIEPARAAPDWDALSEDVRCPLCDYNLRGLREPRCPECGYRFEWPDLLDPRRRLHPYLFEHHPERRVWSFRKTLLGGLRPRRFWKSLHPSQPSCPNRLIGYCLACAAPVLLALLVALGCGVMFSVNQANAARTMQSAMLKTPRAAQYRQSMIKKYGSIQAYLDETIPVDLISCARLALDKQLLGPSVFIALMLLAWSWLTALVLLLFRVSMKRRRVGASHVLRCVIYSADTLVWLGLVISAGLALLGTRFWLTASATFVSSWTIWPFDTIAAGTTILLLVAGVVFTYRLGVAYRDYLQFDRPFATVLASQVIVGFLILNVLAIRVWFQ